MIPGCEEIDVVVTHEDRDPGPVASRTAPGRRSRVVPVVLCLALLVVLGAPVAVDRPVDELAAPTELCIPLPTPRLWCSFVPDDACCPVAGGEDRDEGRRSWG